MLDLNLTAMFLTLHCFYSTLWKAESVIGLTALGKVQSSSQHWFFNRLLFHENFDVLCHILCTVIKSLLFCFCFVHFYIHVSWKFLKCAIKSYHQLKCWLFMKGGNSQQSRLLKICKISLLYSFAFCTFLRIVHYTPMPKGSQEPEYTSETWEKPPCAWLSYHSHPTSPH